MFAIGVISSLSGVLLIKGFHLELLYWIVLYVVNNDPHSILNFT